MSNLKLIPGINLLVLLLYTVFINITSTGSERSLGVAVSMAFCITAQVAINLMASLIKFSTHEPALGRSYLLSAGIVLLIGFSACFGTAGL